jgi:hypothetical protein
MTRGWPMTATRSGIRVWAWFRPVPPKLRHILDLLPMAIVILGVNITVAWAATLVWFFARSVWATY